MLHYCLVAADCSTHDTKNKGAHYIMKSFDYEACVYDGAVYCNGCLPEGINTKSDGVMPIFADSGRHPVIETRLLRFARARDVEPSDVMLVEKRDQLVRNAENAENAENAVMQVLGLTGQCAIPVGSVDINLLYVRVFSMGRALRFFAEGVSSMMDISAPSFETVVSLSPNVYYLRAANDISKAFSCFPGCIPEGDAIGPFKTELEAATNALSL